MRVSKLARLLLLTGLLGLIVLPALPASAEVAVGSSTAEHGDGHAATAAGGAGATSWIDDLGDGIQAIWDYLASVVVGGKPGGKTPGSEIDPDGHKAF